MKYKNLPTPPLKSLTIMLIVALTSCAQETYRTSASDPQLDAPQSKSVSTSGRDAYRQALTALNNDDLDKAQDLFDQFTRRKPGLAGGYANLALIYYKKGEFEHSMQQINRAIELNPNQAQARNIRAQLYIKQGKIHEAKEDYLKAIELKPNYINAQYNLALLYDVYLQEIKLAIKHYKIYLSLIKEPDSITKDWVTHLEGTLKNG